jgi:hypothetical protein
VINHGISNMTKSLTLMVSHSRCRPPFGKFKGTRSIYTSWVMPLCLGLVQFLQLNAKHKNGYRNDGDDDDAGTTATTDATITDHNNAATASVNQQQ